MAIVPLELAFRLVVVCALKGAFSHRVEVVAHDRKHLERPRR
jgi:hypothetical protein